jgi:farnesyl-diphosphate farnesyltransferase
LRAIDEVEDHASIDNHTKALILRDICYGIQKYKPFSTADDLTFNWHGQTKVLPEVTLRLSEWIYYCPEEIRARVADSTGSMADRMAFWAERNWRV